MKKNTLLLSLPLFLLACQSKDAPADHQTVGHYFDLKGYISKEASRLNEKHPLVSKAVMVNENAESKKVTIADWNKELSAFSDADINKSAWQGVFKVTRTNNQDLYTSDNEKVPVQSLLIQHSNGHVKQIRILIRNSNLLYSSNDTLSYYPDSLYEIRKTQRIKLLNEKKYRITGKF